MIGSNKLNLCPAEMAAIVQKYVDEVLMPNDKPKVVSIQLGTDGYFKVALDGKRAEKEG